MKKMIIKGFVILFLALIVGCASIPVKPIMQSDLPDLKGEWKGYYGGGNFRELIELEIFNEKLEGKITFHGTIPAGTVSMPFYGRVEKGKLVHTWGDNWVKLSFHKGDGKMKLEGEYRVSQWSGTMSLHKVVK